MDDASHHLSSGARTVSGAYFSAWLNAFFSLARLLERTAGHGRMRHMGACTLLAVFLVMSVSGAEEVQPADGKLRAIG